MRCEEKVPNGKMVAIEVRADGKMASEVRITGDFFLHPEDAIADVERCLSGVPLDISQEEAESRISKALEGAQLIGASASDLARIFRRACP